MSVKKSIRPLQGQCPGGAVRYAPACARAGFVANLLWWIIECDASPLPSIVTHRATGLNFRRIQNYCPWYMTFKFLEFDDTRERINTAKHFMCEGVYAFVLVRNNCNSICNWNCTSPYRRTQSNSSATQLDEIRIPAVSSTRRFPEPKILESSTT